MKNFETYQKKKAAYQLHQERWSHWADLQYHMQNFCSRLRPMRSDVAAVYELYKESYSSFGSNLEDDGSQLTLVKSEKLNKDQQFIRAWKKCENEGSYVDEKDLYTIY